MAPLCGRFGVRERAAVVVLEASGCAVRFRYTIARDHDADRSPGGASHRSKGPTDGA